MPWSQVSSLLPLSVHGFILSRGRKGQHSHFSAFCARRFSSNFANSRSRPSRWSILTSTSKHSKGLEPASLTLFSIGTIFTYYSAGYACCMYLFNGIPQGASFRGRHSPPATFAQEMKSTANYVKLPEVHDRWQVQTGDFNNAKSPAVML